MLLSAGICACTASTLCAQTGKDSDKMLDKTFQSSAGALKYLLFVPKNYDETKKYPLVVALHGAGSTYITSTDNFEMAHPWIEDSIQARVPHFIMVPEPITGTWGPIGQSPSNGVMNSSSKAVIEGVEDLKKQYSLDTNRFILTGFSLGGSGTYHIIELTPNYWAAAVPASAGGDSGQTEKLAKTPIWHHQGSTDGTAGQRMAKGLENHNHKVVRIVVDFNINTPAGWRTAMQGATDPTTVAYKNIRAPLTVDSLRRAINGGADFLYTELTGGNHEAGWMGAAHNPLVAAWAFSKVKGGAPPVSLAPKAGKTVARRNGSVLSIGVLTRWTDQGAMGFYDIQGRNLRIFRERHALTRLNP